MTEREHPDFSCAMDVESGQAPGAALGGLFPPNDLSPELIVWRLVTPPPAWALARDDIRERLVSRPGWLRLALTGGVASGKSTVAEMLVGFGARHIDFDSLARQAVKPGSAGLEAVRERFGPDLLNPQGALDRSKMAGLIFRDPEAKKALEDIVHPVVWDLMGRELAAYEQEAAVVISVPLLFEAGLETFFSPIVMVFAPPEAQRARLMARSGIGPKEAEAIMASQWPVSPKIMGSTFVINNSHDLPATARQTECVWRQMAGKEE